MPSPQPANEARFEAAFVRFGGSQRYSSCSTTSLSRHALSCSEIFTSLLNIDISCWLSVVLACVGTWVCIEYQIYWNIQLAMLISPIVFPLAFSINESYRRREKVLDDMAAFMGAASELYWMHRDWQGPGKLPEKHAAMMEQDINDLLINLIHYCATEVPRSDRQQRLGAVYRIFSRIAKNNDIIRQSKLPANSPLCTRLIHYHNVMITAFERMRVVREYRTPRSIRGFTKTIVFFLPILLCPYYAFMARKGVLDVHEFGKRNPGVPDKYEDVDFSTQHWSAYYTAVLCCLIFGSLQAVQDTLDDPFDGIGQDDIDLHLITSWTPTALWEKTEDQRIPVLEPTQGEVAQNWCFDCVSPRYHATVHKVPADSGEKHLRKSVSKRLPHAAQEMSVSSPTNSLGSIHLKSAHEYGKDVKTNSDLKDGAVSQV